MDRTNPPLVELIWEDFTSRPGWQEKSQLSDMLQAKPDNFTIRTVAYLLDKDDDRLVLASSIIDANFEAEQGDVVADLFRVPVTQIRELIVLERPEGGDA